MLESTPFLVEKNRSKPGDLRSIAYETDLDSLGAHILIGHTIGNLLPYFEGLKTVTNDLGEMNEHFHAVLAGDKSEPFLFVKPTHFTFVPHGDLHVFRKPYRFAGLLSSHDERGFVLVARAAKPHAPTFQMHDPVDGRNPVLHMMGDENQRRSGLGKLLHHAEKQIA